jgi:hypothetical protein
MDDYDREKGRKMSESEPQREMTFVEWASQNRKRIKELANNVLALRGHSSFAVVNIGIDQDEMHANIMLAYRHLEDAAMRLGKAIQAFEGGTSLYDK